jgi:hypothetical protein
MPYTITTQKSTPGAFYPPALHTLANLDAARKGAQIVANSRRVFTMLWHGAPSFHGRREFFAPQPEKIATAGAYWTETAQQQGHPVFNQMRQYQKECGRNAAAVMAAFRTLYKGRRLRVIGTEQGRQIINIDGPREYIARLEGFFRPGKCTVTVSREYGCASTNPGRPVISGGFCIAATINGQTSHHYTWEGAHACSAYPVPAGEQIAETLCEISR